LPRPRKYSNDAERQRAHRQRQAESTTPVDRKALLELLAAIDAAARAGEEVARRVRTGDPDALLRNLARHFRTAAGEEERARPEET
jgi:uncharacterized protein Yka (UPF0111/DUF47 family)